MRSRSNDRQETESNGAQITRRGVLITGGVVVSALGSRWEDVLGHERSEADTSDVPREVFKPTFTRKRTNSVYELTFRWESLDYQWNVGVEVSASRFTTASSAERSIPRCYDDALSNPALERLAENLTHALHARGIRDELDRVRVATDLVQSIAYVTDLEHKGVQEYPKYANETLVEYAGDCEDLAILLAGVLDALSPGFQGLIVVFPGHAGVGVPAESVPCPDGTLLSIDGREYMFLEPTIDIPAGCLPEPHRNEPVVAVFDGAWRAINVAALTDHMIETIGRGQPLDPGQYF